MQGQRTLRPVPRFSAFITAANTAEVHTLEPLVDSREDKPDIVMHDLDTKFTKEFVAKLKEHGVRNNKLPKASPNLKDHVASCTSLVRWEV